MSEPIKDENLTGIYDQDLKEIRYFSQSQTFEEYAFMRTDGSDLIEANQQCLAVRRFVQEHPEVKDYYEVNGIHLPLFQRFMKEMGKPLDQATPRNVTVLFDLVNFGGDDYVAPLIPIPSLGQFRNRPSSLQAYTCGVRQLCANRWCGGARYFYGGCPYFETTNPGTLDNDGESIFQ
ncbi:MAG: hypothetical protein NWR72_00345 [Bacteroidia bacterium]|nr:hypothetical protein [Bacteroidia bacterium]